jgi:membrane-associated protease RseP (regulator of RpoE activity)
MHERALLHRVIAGLVRRTWLVTIASVIACAGFAATAVAAFVEAAYLTPRAPPIAGGTGEAPRIASPPHEHRSGGPLVARNMFCSTCEPSSNEPGPADSSFIPQGTLIATTIASTTRTATLVVSADVVGTWALGDAVPKLGRIVRIDRASIEIEDASGRHGTLALVGRALPPPREPATNEPWADRLRAIDERTFEVDRELVRDLVSGAVRPGSARAIPAVDASGVLLGLRLVGVQKGSIAAALGMRSGDVVQSIDGTRIASYQTLLEFYTKLDTLQVVRIAGTRGDAPLALELRLR